MWTTEVENTSAIAASMAELVLHINREMLHHGAEIALLRDLYLWRFDGRR